MNNYFYTTYSQFICRFFHNKVQKIPIDIGCTCPVRDGRISHGGCAFCNGRSFVPSFQNDVSDIVIQIEKGIAFFSRKTKNKDISYLVYFQAGTNTYMPVEKACQIVDTALQVDKVKGFVFSTRPDCLSNEWITFLSELSRNTFVEVELGIESVSDEALQYAERGHDLKTAEIAISRLRSIGIPICVHFILGLPFDTYNSMITQAKWLNKMKIDVLKLHQLQILEGSKFALQYETNASMFHLFTVQEYVSLVCDYLERLSPKISIERFVSQSHSDELIAPKWGLKNDRITDSIKELLAKRGSCQGSKLL